MEEKDYKILPKDIGVGSVCTMQFKECIVPVVMPVLGYSGSTSEQVNSFIRDNKDLLDSHEILVVVDIVTLEGIDICKVHPFLDDQFDNNNAWHMPCHKEDLNKICDCTGQELEYFISISEPPRPSKYSIDDTKPEQSKKEEWAIEQYKAILDELVNSKDFNIRILMAEHGYGLDILVNDEESCVRAAVADQGYGLDILVNDSDFDVRLAVAEQGYGLDILINDEDWCVRTEVAKQGYGLDILINDEDQGIRAEVAKWGYGLDILINDEDQGVRATVAEQVYGLDILINDEDQFVREVAIEKKALMDKIREKGIKNEQH